MKEKRIFAILLDKLFLIVYDESIVTLHKSVVNMLHYFAKFV